MHISYIYLSLIYAITNALYLKYNEKVQTQGYILGIIRGFGISILTSPLLFFTKLDLTIPYIIILIFQGILIGIYDSHIFFASAKYKSNSTSGFMATSVWLTFLFWWIIKPDQTQILFKEQIKFTTLIIIISFITALYWKIMKVHLQIKAEIYLYPATISLALMSILTRYIALKSSTQFDGVIYYLTISCFVSGIYNLIKQLIYRKSHPKSKTKYKIPTLPQAIWLVFFSIILITAKTLALRDSPNPGYVVSLLLLTPTFSEIIHNKKLTLTLDKILFLILITLLTVLSQTN